MAKSISLTAGTSEMMRVGAGWSAACVVTLSRAHGVSTMTHDDTMATMNARRINGFIVCTIVREIVIMYARDCRRR